MKKNHSIFLEHILQSINLIEEYTREKTKDDFLIKEQISKILERITDA